MVAGWPIVVRLEARSPDGKPWPVSGVRLESGSWALKPGIAAGKETIAEASTSPRWIWTMAPEESAKLARGAQTVRATVESSGAPRTRELRVQVIDEPAKLHPAWAERKAEVEIEHAFWTEGGAKALSRAEALQAPTWRLLALKAQVLAKLNRFSDGLNALDQAIALWQKQVPIPDRPPTDLLAQREDLLRAAVKADRK